jgi:hypothetical protein
VSTAWRRCRSFSGGAAALTLLAVELGVALGSFAPAASASGPPVVVAAWSSSVFSSSARLQGQVNPNGTATSYHFEYITKAAYDANVAASKDPFSGALRAPVATEVNLGSGTSPVSLLQLLSGLTPDTVYRYRVVTSPVSAVPDTAHSFTTQSSGGSSVLADSRGWEMVSPVDKNGGEAEPPGALFGGGVLQAASAGGVVAYGSRASFDGGGGGAPPASQYIATRNSGGWSSQSISPPLFSGSYDTADGGVPYQLFSGDLSRALLLNGDHCRGEGTDCAVANPPPAGTDAPAGYQNYYLRDNAAGAFEALLGSTNAGYLDLSPADFDISFAGASPDLGHVVLSSCAKLTADASEVAGGSGCDPSKQNLYEYSSGSGLSLINSAPGATLAAQSGAVSATGARVYWTDTSTGNLYLREGASSQQVDADAGGGGAFQAASADGSVAFFTKGGHLWRYLTSTGHATDLTPSGGVTGVLGVDSNGVYVYYQDASGLQLWHSGVTTQIAPGADATNASDYPPTTGTARVSADGTRLLFVSSAYSLTGYDNTDLSSPALCGQPSGICDSQVYLYDGALTCVSCNPTNERPIGPSTIPGAIANGTAPGSTNSYKPRALSADGRRVFFDSRDAIGTADTNNDADAYEWEAQGEGNCVRAGGCASLISSGRAAGGAILGDASVDGSDAFFLTDGSLVATDPGATDLYDARVGGGFPDPVPPIACEGDACQSLPPQPVDPTLTTLLPGPGNPPLRYVNQNKRCKKGFVKRKGRCVRKHKKARHHKRGGGR